MITTFVTWVALMAAPGPAADPEVLPISRIRDSLKWGGFPVIPCEVESKEMI